MQLIELPDGTEVEFPDNMSDEEIATAIQNNFPEFGPKMSAIDAGLLGLGQGVTLGFADEGKAALGAGLDEIMEQAGKVKAWWKDEEIPKDTVSIGERYRQLRDTYRGELAQAAEDQPFAYGAGQVTGSLPAFIASAPLGVVKGGALVGGAMGLGETKDITDIPQVAKDVGTSAAFTAIAGKAGEKILPAVGSVAGKTKEFFAPKALGMTKAMTKKAGGTDAARELGKEALERGIITPMASTKTMQSRVAGLLDESGEQIGAIYKAVDDQVSAPVVNVKDLINTINQRTSGFWGSPNKINAFINKQAGGREYITLQETHNLYKQIGEKSKAAIPTDTQQVGQEASKIIREVMDETVQRVGGDDALKALRSYNQSFKFGKKIAPVLDDKLAGESGNTIFGPLGNTTGLSSAGISAVIGSDPIGIFTAGLTGATASRLFRTRAPQLIAGGINNIEKLIATVPSKYKIILQEAAKRGAHSLAATHYMLMKTDPEYRKKVLEQEDE